MSPFCRRSDAAQDMWENAKEYERRLDVRQAIRAYEVNFAANWTESYLYTRCDNILRSSPHIKMSTALFEVY